MLFHMLTAAVKGCAERAALVDREGTLAYGELWGRVRALSDRLEGLGATPGVAVCVDSSGAHDFAVGFLASASIGARVLVAPPAPPTLCSELDSTWMPDYILTGSDSGHPRACTGCGGCIATVSVGSESATGRDIASRRLRHAGPVLVEHDPNSDSIVVRSQSNLLREAEGVSKALGLEAGDRIGCSLPVRQSPALAVALLSAIQSRSTLYLIDGDELTEHLAGQRPTVLISDLDSLCEHMAEVRRAIDSIRLILVPHCARSPQLLDARAALAGKLVTFYHRRDTGVIALNRHGGTTECVGRLLPGVRVSIERVSEFDATGRRRSSSFGSFVPLAGFPRIFRGDSAEVLEPGVPGWVVIESPTTADACTHNGKLHTSNMGYLDAQGELHLLSDGMDMLAPRARCA